MIHPSFDHRRRFDGPPRIVTIGETSGASWCWRSAAWGAVAGFIAGMMATAGLALLMVPFAQ